MIEPGFKPGHLESQLLIQSRFTSLKYFPFCQKRKNTTNKYQQYYSLMIMVLYKSSAKIDFKIIDYYKVLVFFFQSLSILGVYLPWPERENDLLRLTADMLSFISSHEMLLIRESQHTNFLKRLKIIRTLYFFIPKW